MNWRTIIILSTLVIVSSIGLLYLSREQKTDLKKKSINTLIVGTNAEYPPFSFIENDKIVGFDIDIIKEIAHRLHKKISIKNMSFAALLPELQLGSIHAIAAGVTPTEEKAKRAFFTTVHFDGDPLMAIQPISAQPITNAQELQNKVVAVNQGYTADQYISDIEDVDALRLSTSLVSTGILTLQSKQADVYVVSKSAIKPYFESQKEQQYQSTPLEGTEETYALAVSKKYPELYTAIQSALTSMIEDGTIQKLKEKWRLA